MRFLRFGTWVVRGVGWLALGIGGATAGCSDSGGNPQRADAGDSGLTLDGAPARGDAGALAMCDAHDRPANSVLVDDTQGDPLATQGPQCFSQGHCQGMELEGVVTAIGDGVPAEIDAAQYGWKDAETHWIKIGSAGRVWTIGARNLPPFAVREGSAVSASYFFAAGGFSPDQSALELRVGGQLAFYYGISGEVQNLSLPDEIAVERGAATCKSVDDCLTWYEYDLGIALDGRTPVTLGTGESKVQGDYELKNFRSALSTGATQCSDAFVADTTIVVARTSPLSKEPDEDAGSEGDAGL